jgi:hypothetical protein
MAVKSRRKALLKKRRTLKNRKTRRTLKKKKQKFEDKHTNWNLADNEFRCMYCLFFGTTDDLMDKLPSVPDWFICDKCYAERHYIII